MREVLDPKYFSSLSLKTPEVYVSSFRDEVSCYDLMCKHLSIVTILEGKNCLNRQNENRSRSWVWSTTTKTGLCRPHRDPCGSLGAWLPHGACPKRLEGVFPFQNCSRICPLCSKYSECREEADSVYSAMDAPPLPTTTHQTKQFCRISMPNFVTLQHSS